MPVQEKPLVLSTEDLKKPETIAALDRWRRLVETTANSNDPVPTVFTEQTLPLWFEWQKNHPEISRTAYLDKFINDQYELLSLQYPEIQQEVEEAIKKRRIPKHHNKKEYSNYEWIQGGKFQLGKKWSEIEVKIVKDIPELKGKDISENDFQKWLEKHPDVKASVWYYKKYADAQRWRELKAKHPELAALSINPPKDKEDIDTQIKKGKALQIAFEQWQKEHPEVPIDAWKWKQAADRDVTYAGSHLTHERHIQAFAHLSQVEKNIKIAQKRKTPYITPPPPKQVLTAEMVLYKNKHIEKKQRKTNAKKPSLIPLTSMSSLESEASMLAAAAASETTRVSLNQEPPKTSATNTSDMHHAHDTSFFQSTDTSEDRQSNNSSSFLRRFKNLRPDRSVSQTGENIGRNWLAQGRSFFRGSSGKLGRQLGSATRSAFRGVGKQIGKQLVKQGGKMAARLAAETSAEVAAATSEFWLPIVIILLLILLLILIIIVIILILLGANSGNDTNALPVTITKSANKLQVANPPPGQPGEDITYTISVSYAGHAQDIVTTDPIPENAEFVSASPQPDLELDPVTKLVKSITWHASKTSTASVSATPAPGTSSATFNASLFSSYGFPPPQDPNPVSLNQEGVTRWKTYAMNAILKAAQETNIDPGILSMWSFYDGINYDINFDNCNDSEYDPNTPCMVSNWQIGYGIRPAETISYLQEAFDKMHSGESVQKVGQAAMDSIAQRDPAHKITYPGTTFPNVTIQDLVTGFKNGDPQMRSWTAILMKDDGIDVYILAKVFQALVGPSMASTMAGWGSYYNPQKIINTIKAVYDAGISGTAGGGASFAPQTYTVTLRPSASAKDTYIINQASAQVIGGSGGGNPTVSGTPVSADKPSGWPTSGNITQGPNGPTDHFSLYKDGLEALDIANATGTPIYATFDGKVKIADSSCGTCNGPQYHYGNYVVLTDQNNSFEVFYGHFVSINVTTGSDIKKGQIIGYMGNTGFSYGPHTHYEFRNLKMAPPYIPQAISPINCDSDFTPCSPGSMNYQP